MKTENNRNIAGIIPARYASSRFPGKPLEMIGGKMMIQRVYEKVTAALETVFVATDDIRIYDAVKNFGGNAVMTSEYHRSGTDRCAEAAQIVEKDYNKRIDVVINIQGDEPFIRPEQITLLASCFGDSNVEIATLIRAVRKDEDLFNINQPKVVTAVNGDALYFSRSTIPFFRGAEREEWAGRHNYFKHIGIYGYRKETLYRLTALKPGLLETAESLEQNRWLENGFRIRTAITDWESIGIDTPDDLERASEFLKEEQ